MSYEAIRDIDPQLFRAYDIRGMVDHTLHSDAVYTIARAIGSRRACVLQLWWWVATNGYRPRAVGIGGWLA